MPTATDQEFRSTLARIEAKIDMILARPSGNFSPAQGSSLSSDIVYMSQFTTKQHAILQMLCRDASNEEIAKRLKVAPDTIKTHTVIIRKKLAAPRRAAVITSYAPVLARISDDDYLEASGGLPKSWDSEYRQDDPVNDLVTSRSN